MERLGEGWHELVTDRARAGTRYRFVLPDGLRVPDPASRYQPEDVHGPSEVIDPAAYIWGDAGWNGRAWEDAVVYELHIGAFTPEGTFRAAIDKLDHLVALGVTAIEIMPIGDFPGRRNWGYDGVLPYAPDSAYGRPEDLKALVEAAHSRGLMVLLDVVYNHFGPEGAYIHPIAPQAFTDRHKTPWGAQSILTGPTAARCASSSFTTLSTGSRSSTSTAFGWTRCTPSSTTARSICSRRLPSGCARQLPERQVHLVLENEENQAGRLARGENGEPRWYTAQWNDDVHHVLHVAASGETKGYYADYKGDTGEAGPRSRGGLRVSGRADALSRPTARRTERRPAAHCFCRIHPEPRPGRQSGFRRSGHRFRPGRSGARDQRRSICCCRRSRCCSWARNGARRSHFRSSAISDRSWRMPCARAGGRSSHVFRNFRIRLCASASPTRWRTRHSPPPN